MGAWVNIDCPETGCSYRTTFRLGMGEEDDPDAYDERVHVLGGEHPNHPES
ncbi:hypothetical protein GFS60_06657 (plasmid) [Rhodococcus sp. WAY2]|nr:hypothetical protein GFS60_06657 [Rhodococcus sp. WAY2]